MLNFYPEDNTCGCTLDAADFSAGNAALAKMGVVLPAMGPESPGSRRRFAYAHNLTITLLSDRYRAVLEKYGAWGKKNLYGKESTGVIRSTFLIGPDGRMRRFWTKVKVPGHAAAVKEEPASLLKG
jgi:thioredoxin-dependent peroxiredoxin